MVQIFSFRHSNCYTFLFFFFCFSVPDKGNAVIRKMCIQVDGRPDMEIDLDKGTQRSW